MFVFDHELESNSCQVVLAAVTLEYETTMRDVDAWYRQYLKLPDVASRIRVQSFYAALSTGVLVFVLMLALSKDATVAGIVGGLLLVVMWALMGPGIRGETLKRAKRAVTADVTSPALGKHTLEITPSELVETCPYHKLSIRWDAVEKLIETEAHLFILLRGHAAITIPASAFSSEEARSNLIREVHGYLGAHGNASLNRTT